MAGELQPLSSNQRIVNIDGTPNDYFIRWAQERQIDIGEGITAAQALEIIQQFTSDHALTAGSGIGLAPSGDIADDITITAKVQEILDQISATRGTVLYRGAAGWAGLAPGASGTFLKTNGPGADPAWAAAGGGGGARPTIVQSGIAIGATPTVTLPATPTPGNLLVCLATHFNNTPTANTGWATLLTTNGANDGLIVLARAVKSSDTTSQTPFTTGASGVGVTVFEIADAGALSVSDLSTLQEVAGASQTILNGVLQNSCLLIGMAETIFSNAATTGFTGATLLDTLTGTTAGASPRRITTFNANVDKGAADVTVTWAGSVTSYIIILLLRPA